MHINIEDVLNANTAKEREEIYLSTLEKFIFSDLQKIEELLVESVSIAYSENQSIYLVTVKLKRHNHIDVQQKMLIENIIALVIGDSMNYDLVIKYSKNE